MLKRPSTRLTHEYLRNHPEDAARVLERLPVEAVGALLTELPARLGAPALGAMLPHYAARCIAALPPASAGALLAHLSAPRAGAVLRQLDDSGAESIYPHLSSSHALRIKRLRSYPEESVGAWTETDVEVFGTGHCNRDVREQLRPATERPVHQIYIVDHRHQLQGTVSISALLQGEPEQPLSMLMHPSAQPLRTRMSLGAARRHRGWAAACELPVVETNGEFIGALRLAALHQRPQDAAFADDGSWITAVELVTQGYCAGAAGVLRGLFEWWSTPR